jgi:hypothetical protein
LPHPPDADLVIRKLVQASPPVIAPIISANVKSMYLVIIDVLILGRQFTKKMRL